MKILSAIASTHITTLVATSAAARDGSGIVRRNGGEGMNCSQNSPPPPAAGEGDVDDLAAVHAEQVMVVPGEVLGEQADDRPPARRVPLIGFAQPILHDVVQVPRWSSFLPAVLDGVCDVADVLVVSPSRQTRT